MDRHRSRQQWSSQRRLTELLSDIKCAAWPAGTLRQPPDVQTEPGVNYVCMWLSGLECSKQTQCIS